MSQLTYVINTGTQMVKWRKNICRRRADILVKYTNFRPGADFSHQLYLFHTMVQDREITTAESLFALYHSVEILGIASLHIVEYYAYNTPHGENYMYEF